MTTEDEAELIGLRARIDGLEAKVRKLKRSKNLSSKTLARVKALPARLENCALGARLLDARIGDAFEHAKSLVEHALRGDDE